MHISNHYTESNLFSPSNGCTNGVWVHLCSLGNTVAIGTQKKHQLCIYKVRKSLLNELENILFTSLRQ